MYCRGGCVEVEKKMRVKRDRFSARARDLLLYKRTDVDGSRSIKTQILRMLFSKVNTGSSPEVLSY